MQTLQRQISPDGTLVLAVIRGNDGEISVGFEGGEWHTHPSLLAAWLGVPEAAAVEEFLARVQRDELPIVWSTDGGDTVEPWVSDNLSATIEIYGQTSCVIRVWSGMQWQGESA